MILNHFLSYGGGCKVRPPPFLFDAYDRLLAEAGTLLTCEALDEYRETPSGCGDPEGVYERRLLRKHLLWLVEEYLDPREQTLARFYFGMGDHAGDGMTLENLAVRLNYNSPSGAWKALDRAIQKLRANFESGEWGRWQGAENFSAWRHR